MEDEQYSGLRFDLVCQFDVGLVELYDTTIYMLADTQRINYWPVAGKRLECMQADLSARATTEAASTSTAKVPAAAAATKVATPALPASGRIEKEMRED